MIKMNDNGLKYCDVCLSEHTFLNLDENGQCNYCKRFNMINKKGSETMKYLRATKIEERFGCHFDLRIVYEIENDEAEYFILKQVKPKIKKK